MIGIVVVSHSPLLAQAAVDLALEMVSEQQPAIAIAAGAAGGVTGTDAVKVSEAITEVSSPDGVLVMMDLGSAVLSAELALELLPDSGFEVRLTSAPFVEGLLAGVVRAAGGASLDEVEREARGALAAKRGQLGQDAQAKVSESPVHIPGHRHEAVPPEAAAELPLVNTAGLHARPAAMLIAAISPLDARVMIANRRTGRQPLHANGPTALLTLAARQGDVLEVTATGKHAAEAVSAVRELVEAGFGELNDHRPDGMNGRGPIGIGGLAKREKSHRARPPRAVGVSPGRAVGPVARMAERLVEPPVRATLPREDRGPAADRIETAALAVQAELQARANRVRGQARDILLATASIAVDQALITQARSRVLREGDSPERSVWCTITQAADELAAAGGAIAERVADLHDVRDRIVAWLLGRPAPGLPDRAGPFVLVAHDLAPADAALIDPRTCLALITAEGGPTSHTAILARSLGLPAIVGAPEALDLADGTIVLVDGTTGVIVVDPVDSQVAEVKATARPATEFDGRGRTRDGHPVELLANVAAPGSVDSAVAARAEGVGLFRTEFCFLDRAQEPSAEEQVAAYRRVLRAFPGKKVVIRTLDAGSDKPLAFVTTSHEPNPALGVRGFRTSWRRPELLDAQLAAISEASAREEADIWVMAPMIGTPDEAAAFAERCDRHGLRMSGVMIEVPAAAIVADQVLDQVSFASLGTNDLAQYTMAADRSIGELAPANDPWQPAVLRMIQLACTAALNADKPMGVCGEAAADPLLAAVLVGFGASSLSMVPRALGPVAAMLRQVTRHSCAEAARATLGAATPAAARAGAARVLGLPHPTEM